jgi:putative phosphoserine phosphatase/1-acylglycerol-3-phosphate O-acyltransferase
MRVQALVRRWPTVYLDVPPGVPKIAGVEAQQVAMPFARPELLLYAKLEISGTDNIPAEGPAIICGNHRSYFDPLAVGYALAQRGRPCRFLGKKEVFDAPVIGDLMRAAGGIRVDRGTGSDQPLEEAAQALRAGELVAIMPQGTIPRGKAFFDPELKGRWGAARLAALTGAPVIPLGLWGTEKVWPRNARLPNVLNFVSPPTVTVTVGPPVEIGGTDPDVDTKAIMAAIAALLPPEAREHREPSREELARTLPSSYKGDPELYEEPADRRPGAD